MRGGTQSEASGLAVSCRRTSVEHEDRIGGAGRAGRSSGPRRVALMSPPAEAVLIPRRGSYRAVPRCGTRHLASTLPLALSRPSPFPGGTWRGRLWGAHPRYRRLLQEKGALTWPAYYLVRYPPTL